MYGALKEEENLLTLVPLGKKFRVSAVLTSVEWRRKRVCPSFGKGVEKKGKAA